MLRLLNGALVCCRCCIRRGVLVRAGRSDTSVRQRAEHRIPKLRAMLESPCIVAAQAACCGAGWSGSSGSRRRCARCAVLVSQSHGRYRDVVEQTRAMEIPAGAYREA